MRSIAVVVAAMAMSSQLFNLGAAIRYVDVNGTNQISPYTNWATAATSIQEAVDVANDGDEVRVTDGLYDSGGRAVEGLTNRVAVYKAIAVRSVNGPLATIIKGYQVPGVTNGVGAIRCAYLTNGASLSGFTLTGGATLSTGSARAIWGGGVWCEWPNAEATVSNCIVTGNAAFESGGGVGQGTFYNCVVTSNQAGLHGGGAMWATLNNCTLVGNLVTNTMYGGGGAFGCNLNNCIISFNSAPAFANISGGTLTNCWTEDPHFVDLAEGNLRLQSNSPCINAGNNSSAPSGFDLDGNPRIFGGIVDIGAYEFQGLPAPEAPVIQIHPTDRTVTVGSNVIFSVTASGTVPLRFQWRSNAFNISGATGPSFVVSNAQLAHSGTLYSVRVTNVAGTVFSSNALLTVNPPPLIAPAITVQPTNQTVTVDSSVTFVVVVTGTLPLRYFWNLNGATPSWATNASITLTNVQLTQSGNYFVTITNAGGTVVSSNVVLTVNPPPAVGTHYVDPTSVSPQWPYTNWATAAREIQSAIDASVAGDEISVTNGVYQTGQRIVNGAGNTPNRVAVTKAVTVRSVNGADHTLIVGSQAPSAAVRCVFLTNGSAIVGFTLTNGSGAGFGGGAFGQSSNRVAISNCVIVGNSGGGVYFGTLTGCLLSRNVGGGAKNSKLINCQLVGNFASSGGGANGCTLINCLVANNSADTGGGTSSCKLVNCTVVGNLANTGGGIASTTASNSIIVGNFAANGNNFTYPEYPSVGGSTLSYCCTAPETNGPGNIFVPPLFVNESANDFRLLPNSPCINAGNNAYVSGATDLDGNPRIAGGTVDIGAYEFQNPGSKISYAWLQQNALPYDGSADQADGDGDQASNWQEWRAGTSPMDASSLLKLIRIEPGASQVNIAWQSVSNRSYFIERCTNLLAPAGFSILATNVVGKSGITIYTNTITVGADQFFYRVGVQP